MKKRTELEIKYNLDEVKSIKELERNLHLKVIENIVNEDVYYETGDVLEAYKITLRARTSQGKTIYQLKKEVDSPLDFDAKEIYEFDALESAEEFLQSNFYIFFESLTEKTKVITNRTVYELNFGNAVFIVNFDCSKGEIKKANMLEFKLKTGSIKDIEDLKAYLVTCQYLTFCTSSKKDLNQKKMEKASDPFNFKPDKESYDLLIREYFGSNQQLLDRLKKLDERKLTIKELRTKFGPLPKPVVLTISGTPRAGKTTCIDNLYEFFKKAGFKTACLAEPAGLVYQTLKSKEEKEELLKDRVGFVEKQFEIGTEYIAKNLNANDILLCDRGILDPFIWYDMYYKLGMMDEEKYYDFLKRASIPMEYHSYLYMLYASSKTAMIRDYQSSLSLEPRSTMNEDNVVRYNSSILRMMPFFSGKAESVSLINTTDLAKMDASIMIAEDLADKIEGLYLRREK